MVIILIALHLFIQKLYKNISRLFCFNTMSIFDDISISWLLGIFQQIRYFLLYLFTIILHRIISLNYTYDD